MCGQGVALDCCVAMTRAPLNFSCGIAHSRRSAGMSLVEVLVALVSTSVGLLGVAALQLATVRGAQEANVRLQATALASSMLERIRVNPRGFRSGEYRVTFNGRGPSGRSGEDIREWQAEIDRTLPGGIKWAAGAIDTQPGTNVVVVTIRWNQTGDRKSAESRPSLVQIRSEI